MTDSITAERGDSLDNDFEGFWLVEVNIVHNKNDGLNVVMKSVAEKAEDTIHKAMAKTMANCPVKDDKMKHCTERSMLRRTQSSDGFVVDCPLSRTPIFMNNFDTNNSVVVREKKKLWMLGCSIPCVRY